MSQILNKVRDVDASDSEAVKDALGIFFQNLLKYKDIDSFRWLRVLENVIDRFPNYCGIHRFVIESYLTHFLNSNNFYNVIEAAKCAHAVQQVRPAQEKAATAKACWREQMISLCDAAHKLTDALFDKNTVMYRNLKAEKDKQVLANSPLHEAFTVIDSLADNQENAVNKTAILYTRLKNVLVFIQAMLVEVYPVPKPIQPQLILAVILQTLSAPGSQDSTNVTTIKIQAVRTLDALVECLGSNLIPFSALVFRFVMQTLKWSAENPSEEIRKVRIAAYSSLSKWLDSLHTHRPAIDGRSTSWHDELVEHIVSDVKPTKHIMQLMVNAQPTKNLSKKARKRLANTMLKGSNIAMHAPGEKTKNNLSDVSKDEVAVAALECAETFLSVCGIFLKNATHKLFQELLVRECFATNNHSSKRAMCLLHALEACRKNCSANVPPPTQYCLELYSVLVNSQEREVSKFCSQALLDIRLHLHCSPASLNFSIQEPSLKQKAKEDGRKRVSERNRAVLEKLLGIEWMNSGDTTDSVITIPDEPATKRSRVETDTVPEIIENVHSISSDSVQTVEMISDAESIIEGVDIVINDTITIHVNSDMVNDEPTQELDNGDGAVIGNSTRDETVNENSTRDEAVIENSIREEPTNILDTPDETTQGIKNLAIHDELTQADPIVNVQVDGNQKDTNKNDAEVEKIMETPTDSQFDINEAKTQLLQNSGTIDGKSPLSMEVAYDYPNTGNDKVTILDKMDDENLPSTSDTDDIQIACGQDVKSSQDSEKNKDAEVGVIPVVVTKVNGVGDALDIANEVTVKKLDETAAEKAPNDKVVTVEDMLADFVDEVNEEIQA